MKNPIIILSLLITNLAWCQDPTNPVGSLITDRPDVTESAATVGKGILQLETGGFYTESKNASLTTKETTFNTTLLRYGILDNVELRLGTNYLRTTFDASGVETGNTLNGTTPVLLGFKVAIADENGWMPKLGLLTHLFLPITIGTDYKPDNTGLQAIISAEHTLSARSGLGYNLGAILQPDGNQLTYTYSISYSYDLSPTIGTFVEFYGDFPENGNASHLFDAGFAYLANDNLQFDLSAGTGICANQKLLFSLGLSYRFLKK